MSTATQQTSPNQNKPIHVNPELIWDYAIPPEHEQSEAFRRWYIARVLTRGRIADLQMVSLSTIFHYWPTLNLPSEIYQFWNWYLNLPEIKERYGNLNPIPTSGVDRLWSDTHRP